MGLSDNLGYSLRGLCQENPNHLLVFSTWRARDPMTMLQVESLTMVVSTLIRWGPGNCNASLI